MSSTPPTNKGAGSTPPADSAERVSLPPFSTQYNQLNQMFFGGLTKLDYQSLETYEVDPTTNWLPYSKHQTTVSF